MEKSYLDLLNEFKTNPRDVHTVPLGKRSYKWFYVYVDNGALYVESAKDKLPRCSLKKRMLYKKEFNEILSLYIKRKKSVPVSQEAMKCTQSQVYWYGIFNEMNW